MTLTREEAERQQAERLRIIGDTKELSVGQVVDRYLEAARWAEMQPGSSRVDYLATAAAAAAYVIGEIAQSNAEMVAMVAFAGDAVDNVKQANERRLELRRVLQQAAGGVGL